MAKDVATHWTVEACESIRDNYYAFIAYYSDELHDKSLYNEKLISDFHVAIKQHQFEVFYQPKYLITGEKPVLSSADALIRWRHPEFGMVSPGLFIPLFESNGLIQKLDYYVFEEVARQLGTWKKELGLVKPVSVNLSRIDIYHPHLKEEIEELLHQNNVTTEEILLEVTESGFLEDSGQIIPFIEDLRQSGFVIEMDDFGSGYSSLNMLASMPFDVLKIDMQFIRSINKGEKNNKIVKMIIDIAKAMNATVVAEGVEEAYQYQFLKDNGCDVIQGYYFSKPLPKDLFEQLLIKEGKDDR